MYGIGTVARLAQVSVRTLRHYDEVGLLKPAHVDPLTGDRRYTPDQVLRLHRILVLRCTRPWRSAAWGSKVCPSPCTRTPATSAGRFA